CSSSARSAARTCTGGGYASGRSPTCSSSVRSRSSASRGRTCSDLPRKARVLCDEILVRALRAPAALAMEIGDDERRRRLAVHARLECGGERGLDQRLDVVERLVRRAAEQDSPAPELPVRARDARGL